ncbi:MAG: hypothetical protein AB7V43_01145 [Acidimicrobiia bacterium]
MRSRWATGVLVSGTIAALGACSNGSGGSSEPTGTDSSVRTSSVVSTVQGRIAASTTALAQLTTVATTAATAAVLPDAQVRADYLQLHEAYSTCLRAPTSCDPSALTASVGPARGALSTTIKDMVSGGLFAGADDPGYAVVEKVDVTGPTTAVVSSCWWDTGVLYGPPAKAGDPPIIVNNLQVTSRFDTTMVLENGHWRTSEEKRTERAEGENRCPPGS